jgi:DNA polymerase delta subunit 1
MESYYRKQVAYKQSEITFQAMEWLDFNLPINTFEGSGDSDQEEDPDEHYIIKCFGVTKEGYSVCLNITDYTPFFYIKVPDNFSVIPFLNNLEDTVGYYYGKPYNPLYKWKKYLLRDKCKLVRKKDFYGFTNGKLFTFLRLTFNNSEAMRKVVYLINAHNDPEIKTKIRGYNNLQVYESNVDSILRLIHIRNLQPCGWLKADNIEVENVPDSTCQIEATVKWTDIHFVENTINAPILQASFDIEVYSVDRTFPQPEVPGNVVTQIGTVFKKMGSDDFYVNHIISLGKCSPLDKTDIPTILECYDTEKEVLLAWKRLLVKMDPDILYSYNGDQFDCNYLGVRAKMTRCESEFYKLGKLKNVKGEIKDKEFNSSAYGKTIYKRLSIPGRINFDLLVFIQREYKEDKYTLNYISEKYLGDHKDEVSVNMIFDYNESGDPDKIKEIVMYCVQDCKLPQRLVDTLLISQTNISMANVTYVPFKYLIEKGQQVKAFSQIVRETRKEDYLIPCLKSSDSDTFEGATVLEPNVGYYDDPIVVMDFASLYPSIMRAHNCCYSTIILDPIYDNIDGVSYETIEWDETDKKTGSVKHLSYRYCQSQPGILGKLLAELTESRKMYKGKMKESKNNKTLYEIYNKCQLAVKVSMNSMYGFLAAQTLQCKPIAASVTAVGRQMIEKTKNFAEEKYNGSCQVVYGDSVTGDTPLLLKDPITNLIHIKTIEQLSDESLNLSGTIEYPGFKLDSSIREEKQYSLCNYEIWSDLGWTPIKKVIKHKTNKKIFRVTTNKGSVDVTEDHSLININLKKVKPGSLQIGDNLLHSFPTEGICKDYIGGVASKLQLQMLYFEEKINGNIKHLFPPNVVTNIKEMDSVTTEQFVYDIETECGRYQAGIGEIIVSNTDSIFLSLTTETCCKYKTESERIYSKTVITETDRNHLKQLKRDSIAEAMILGKECADLATKTLFRYPVKLEYEKVYDKLLMLSKKKYIALLYSDNPDKPDYQDSKGIVLKRRDNTKQLKKLYQNMIDILMTDGKLGIKFIVENIKNDIMAVIDNRIDHKELIISKAYKPPYKSKIPHAVLAEKLGERDPGNKPRSNDRIEYLFVDTNSNKKLAQYEKVEDPKFVKEHNLPLDCAYYIEHLQNPMCEILQLFMKNPESIFLDAINEYNRNRNSRLLLPAPRETKYEKIKKFRNLLQLLPGETDEQRQIRAVQYKNNKTNTKIINELLEELE